MKANDGDPDETVEALDATMTGVWLVTTRNTEHVWDLEANTYARFPSATSSCRFAADGRPGHISRVERWPVVGQSSVMWFDDPERPDALEHWRVSSTIRRIERLRPGHRLHPDTSRP